LVRGAAVFRRETSASHGGRWKRLISRYIETMPPDGSRLGPDVQTAIGSPELIQAMTAKVGAAARQSQSGAANAIRVVIFDFSLNSRPSPAVAKRD
jgi:hypothetical protein